MYQNTTVMVGSQPLPASSCGVESSCRKEGGLKRDVSGAGVVRRDRRHNVVLTVREAGGGSGGHAAAPEKRLLHGRKSRIE